MRSKIRKNVDLLYQKTETSYRAFQARKDAKRIVKAMGLISVELHEKYQKEIIPFWQKYNMRPSKYWFQLFSSDGVTTDPRYIPEDLWYGTILPYYSNMLFRRPYEDKCMHHIFFPKLNRPRTIVKRIACQYYTDDLHLLTEKEAFNLCKKEDRFILKPSLDSGTGRLIQFYDSSVNNEKDLMKMLFSMGGNFIVQEIVKQHPVLASLHEPSLNTVRVLSFFFEEEVHILSCIVRMGAGNQRVDNVSSGGMQCGINMDGTCHKLACTKKRDWVAKHPDGAVFASIKIPSFKQITDIIKEEHLKLPHFRLIGWDFSVDTEGSPVFIEYNVCPGANQMTCGPTFGSLTEKVLNDILMSKTLVGSQN